MIDLELTPLNAADEIFKDNIRTILEENVCTPSARAKWDDGSPANTIKTFGICNKYCLSDPNIFPAISLRPIAFKNCVDELLWIYQKKSNNVNDLNSHIWDQWADESGSIGKAYGWQIANKKRKVICPPSSMFSGNELWLDQIDYVRHELKYNKYSRRILIDMYCIEDLKDMNLDPCAYSITFNVTSHVDENGNTKEYLNAILNQRSNDFIVANNWNVVQYAVLVHLLAKEAGLIPGVLTHMIGDTHIYVKHLPIANELLSRESKPSCGIWINPEIDNFYKYTVDDIKLVNYEAHPQITNIPVAI